MSQYFDNVEGLAHQDITYQFELMGERYTFSSDAGVFSKDGLDDGTRLLLETIAKTDLGTNILDLGCGVGPIGLILAHIDSSRHVVLADVNDRALECARKNAVSLGVSSQVELIHSDVYSNINSSFSTIVTNPPIRACALSHLNQDGSLILVIRKKQGAESCFRYLQTLFGKVEVKASHKGFQILIARK